MHPKEVGTGATVKIDPEHRTCNALVFAYADPPYPGQARRHYRDDPRCAEVDHAVLADTLRGFDAWALSTSSTALVDVLPLFPGARVAAWVKPFATFKKGQNPVYSWEPVIFHARRRGLEEPHVKDWCMANPTMKKGTHGAKPDAFWVWLFDLLGARPGDTFVDLFPGTARGSQVWANLQGQGSPLPLFQGGPNA